MRRPRRPRLLAAAALFLGGAAWALPWDIDMVDADFFRGYEWRMLTPPEGTVSRNRFVRNFDRTTPEGLRLANPYPVDEQTLVVGEKMFATYCQACHGEEGKGQAPVADNSPADERFRYKIPPALLSGEGSVTALKTDGYIYLTIRNGGAIMPSYGTAMDDREIWAVVAYLRTLDGAAYTGPEF